MYSLLYLLDQSKSSLLRISQNKQPRFGEILFSDKGIQLLPIVEYIYSLGYNSEPDYNKIAFMFKKILLEQDMVPSVKLFDWHRT